MATTENLAKMRSILSTFADLIRESEGTTGPISVADMRQKIASIDVARFNISTVNGETGIYGHVVINGTPDSSTPTDIRPFQASRRSR